MKGKDLGTYHLRVEFSDGRGYISQWHTGMRFSHGMDNSHPLKATRIQPTWASEEDLGSSMRFMYLDGNYSCDCNRKIFLAAAEQKECDDDECGHSIILKRLTMIRPDATEKVIYEAA